VPGRRQQRDLPLLGRERGQAGVGLGDRDAGGAQLAVGPGRPRDRPEPVKDLGRARQLLAGVGRPLDPAQGGTVGELDPGEIERPAVVARLGDRVLQGGGVGLRLGSGLWRFRRGGDGNAI
jgi:hypothetical protein